VEALDSNHPSNVTQRELGEPSNPPLPPHPTIPSHYHQPNERAAYVRDLFDRAAPDYDRLSRILSFGSDRWYRQKVIRHLRLPESTRILDVATGTGLTMSAARANGIAARNLVGLDPSAGMLAAHTLRTEVNLVRGLGEQLPFREASFELVTMGYALRHVADLNRLFKEFWRVLSPGGRVAILEITRPRSRILRHALRGYFLWCVPFLVRARRDSSAATIMDYYWSTIDECVGAEAVLAGLSQAGFVEVGSRVTGPVLTEYLATKRA
jgi:demethylmenaquinone methyltransferase/2-methoxy-6-polyprenyl-1,4-benzoquinol methylase